MDKMHDIGVIGCWFGSNYGSLLNGYATYKILKSFGKTVVMIQKPNAQEDDWELYNTHNSRFIKKYYPESDVSEILPYERLPELNNKCDMFCVGSDQVWNYFINNLFQKSFMANFADDDKKLISFATSFGKSTDITPDYAKPEIYKLLNRFSAISVREQFSADICKNNYGINASLLFEPVFCVNKQEFLDIAGTSQVEIEEPYLLTYILDPTNEKREAIKYYADKLNIKCVNILDGVESKWETNNDLLSLPNTLQNVGAEDFLKLFSNAQYVITDSFHGTAFAIIFSKPFLSIGNIGRGLQRFSDLLERLELSDRLAPNPQKIPHDERYLQDIDYTRAEEIILEERNRAVHWLEKAISCEKVSIVKLKQNNNYGKEYVDCKALRIEKGFERLKDDPCFIKIRLLATLLRDYGIKHIVLSPGGRDVPLVRMFEYNYDQFVLHNITDERSAAYYALGIATQLKQPVACVCTSGTAASNYLPAVTEAYYTGVPLIVITADRCQIFLNHGEDQTIPQKNIYDSVIKMSISLPEGAGYHAEYQTRRDIASCILEATHNGFGPVHINVPVDNIGVGANIPREYWKLQSYIYPHILRVGFNDGQKEMLKWVDSLKKSTRILIVYGQTAPLTEKQKRNVESFAFKYNCVIVTDHISNLDCAYSLKPYNMLEAITQAQFNNELSPDILITVGGKRLMNDPLTFKVRGGNNNIRHWSVTADGKIKDFYFRLSSVIETAQDNFFEWFSNNAGDITNNGEYFSKWKKLTENYTHPTCYRFDSNYIQSKFFPSIPTNSILHLGVGQSFYDCRKYTIDKSVEVYCNMGTNGIDGCTSTFMGQCAVVQDKLCFLIVGDLSFFYDMNSIWNKQPNKNVRILLVNNNGSGLLRNNNLKAVTSVHNTSAEGWVKSTAFDYISAYSKEEFDRNLEYFLKNDAEKALFFEVFCE